MVRLLLNYMMKLFRVKEVKTDQDGSAPVAEWLLGGRETAVGMTLFTCTGDEDGADIGQGAFGFADSTADAQGIVDKGLTNLLRFTRLGDNSCIFKFDRFFRGRTMFLTDNTLNPLGKRQTTIFIEPGVTDLELMLGGKVQHLYGPGGTYLAAERTIKFTITGTGDQVG